MPEHWRLSELPRAFWTAPSPVPGPSPLARDLDRRPRNHAAAGIKSLNQQLPGLAADGKGRFALLGLDEEEASLGARHRHAITIGSGGAVPPDQLGAVGLRLQLESQARGAHHFELGRLWQLRRSVPERQGKRHRDRRCCGGDPAPKARARPGAEARDRLEARGDPFEVGVGDPRWFDEVGHQRELGRARRARRCVAVELGVVSRFQPSYRGL